MTIPTFDPTRFRASMEKLRLAYESKGHHVSTSLRPGLSPDEIGAKTKWFPSSMPPELIALYKWHDGQEGGGWEVKYPFWIRDCVLSSLESAESEYKSIMESYGTFPEFPEDHEMLKHSFPFAAFNGGWMVFPCKGHNLNQAYERPIIFVLQGIEIFFYSIELMANTCIDWVFRGICGRRKALMRREDRCGFRPCGLLKPWKAGPRPPTPTFPPLQQARRRLMRIRGSQNAPTPTRTTIVFPALTSSGDRNPPTDSGEEAIDWVQAGTSEDGEFRLDEDVEMEIWQKHNPGIFAG